MGNGTQVTGYPTNRELIDNPAVECCKDDCLVKLRRPSRLLRIWPLAFSVLALIGILHLAPILYEDFRFTHDGVATYAWYTDLEEQNKYIHYAYRVGPQTFGGRESWDDENSNIYSHRNGERLEISYLAQRPWISRRQWGMQNRWQDSKRWAQIYLGVFLAGILASLVGRRTQIGSEPLQVGQKISTPD
jgi:hypothetical protein